MHAKATQLVVLVARITAAAQQRDDTDPGAISEHPDDLLSFVGRVPDAVEADPVDAVGGRVHEGLRAHLLNPSIAFLAVFNYWKSRAR